MDTLAIGLGLMAATRIPALIGAVSSLVVWLGTAEGLFIAGAVASRGLAIAMNLIPGVALFTGLTVAITGIYRGFTQSAEAAREFEAAMAAVLKTQVSLTAATENYYNNVSKANLDAMLLQAQNAYDNVELALKAAKQELEAASFATNFFGGNFYETDRMEAAKAAIESYSLALFDSESKLSMAEHAALNFKAMVSETITPVDTLAASLGKTKAAVFAQIPALADLSAEYGLAGLRRQRLPRLKRLYAATWAKVCQRGRAAIRSKHRTKYQSCTAISRMPVRRLRIWCRNDVAYGGGR